MNLLLSDGMNMQEGAYLELTYLILPGKIMFITSQVLMQECHFGSKLGQTP